MASHDAGVERRDALALLGLSWCARRAEITAAYHRLARVTHPDISRDPRATERFAALSRAYRAAVEGLDHPDPGPDPVANTQPAARPAAAAELRVGPVHYRPWRSAPAAGKDADRWS